MATVLVVDDSVSVRRVIERALAAHHFDVVTASCAEEAIQRIDAGAPDLVICDVILPDHDGFHVCEYVRRHPRAASAPVLLISGIANSSVLQRAAAVGGSDVMFKPFAAEDLVRKTEELLSGLSVPPTPVEAVHPSASSEHGRHGEEALRDWAAPAQDLKNILEQFVALGGVRAVVVADREGLLIEAVGDLDLPADVTAALASCLVESSEGLGRDLDRGALTGMMLEYASGTLLVHGIGASAMLAVFVDGTAVLGKVRYYAKKVLPELASALAGEIVVSRA